MLVFTCIVEDFGDGNVVLSDDNEVKVPTVEEDENIILTPNEFLLGLGNYCNYNADFVYNKKTK